MLSDTQFNELIAAIRAGDREALGTLLDSFREFLLSIAGTEIRPESRSLCAPSDIVQNSLTDAAKGLPTFNGDRTDFMAWLARITRNNLIDAVRAEQTKRNLAEQSWLGDHCFPETEDDPSPGTQVVRAEELTLVREAVAEADELDQQLVRLRFEEGHSWREVSDLLGLPPETARSRYYRLLKQLQKKLGLLDSDIEALTDGP